MRVVRTAKREPTEVEATCQGCDAVLGMTVLDAVTYYFENRTKVYVFRCCLCGQHVCISESLFTASAP